MPLCVCGHARWEHMNGGHGACIAEDDCTCGEFEPDTEDDEPFIDDDYE